MRRWALVIVVLYAVIILILTWPVIMASFYPVKMYTSAGTKTLGFFESSRWAANVFLWWRYWLFFIVMLLSQLALLIVPVRVASKRPVTKGPIIFPVIASALMMGGLAAGLVLAIGETIKKDAIYAPMWWLSLGELILVWILWALIFFRWNKCLEPKSFIEKQCRYLYRGSILELLVAVPTHVVARCRDYCCAGFATFVGIALGIAVMIFSFGPGVFFLYVERWKRVHPK